MIVTLRKIGWLRFAMIAAIGFRLLSLAPLLFSAPPQDGEAGMVVCESSGTQRLATSSRQQLGLIAAVCSLAAGEAAILPPLPSPPAPLAFFILLPPTPGLLAAMRRLRLAQTARGPPAFA